MARTVLRGGGAGNSASLPDVRHEVAFVAVIAWATMTSPDVLPSVSYRSMRERQLSGVKPPGQCILALSRVATGSRDEVATASIRAVGD